jgi:hypothetical protein
MERRGRAFVPIVEKDPWRMQYFERVACPEDVVIPTDDEESWRLYPAHRWVYNKLLICETQGLEHGPHGIAPSHFPVFSKPAGGCSPRASSTTRLRRPATSGCRFSPAST